MTKEARVSQERKDRKAMLVKKDPMVVLVPQVRKETKATQAPTVLTAKMEKTALMANLLKDLPEIKVPTVWMVRMERPARMESRAPRETKEKPAKKETKESVVKGV